MRFVVYEDGSRIWVCKANREEKMLNEMKECDGSIDEYNRKTFDRCDSIVIDVSPSITIDA